MTGAQSDLIGMDVGGSDPVAGDESEGPMTPSSQEAGSVFISCIVVHTVDVFGVKVEHVG